MSNQSQSKKSADLEGRAQALDRTIAAYADAPQSLREDLASAEQRLGLAHLAGVACNCGLCGAMAQAEVDVNEILATAHLLGAECGCARCMALAAPVDEGHCPGPGTPQFNQAELERLVNEGGGGGEGGEGDAPAGPEGDPQGAAPEGSATLERATAAVDIAAAEAQIAAQVASQFEQQALSANELAFANMLTAAAEVAAHAGVVVPAKPAGFPGTLGLTTWNYGTWTYPDLKVDVAERAKGKAKEWVGKIQATTVKDATHSAVAAPTGKHKYDTVSVPVAGKATNFDVYLDITAAYYGKIRDAEQEHLNDLLHAYNLSIKAAGDAVNSLTAAEYIGTSNADAETKAKAAVAGKLHASLGSDPANWRTQLRTLATMTISGRDNLGWHTFGLDTAAAKLVVDVKAKTITHGLNDGTTSINAAPSATVVHF
jgi:hypothetical protein